MSVGDVVVVVGDGDGDIVLILCFLLFAFCFVALWWKSQEVQVNGGTDSKDVTGESIDFMFIS